MQVESRATLLLTVDEVEKIQRQKFVGVVTRVLQLTYAAMLDRLIQEEKLNRCHGCVIQHPSQREHSCLMMDSEEAWLFYHDEARENIDVNDVLNTANNVCSVIGFKLSNSWETYVRELYKFPWTTLFLTSLELEKFGERTQTKQLEDSILYAINYGPNGLKPYDFSDMEVYEDHNIEKVMNVDPMEVQCPESIVRKDEEPMNIDFTISEIQNKLFI